MITSSKSTCKKHAPLLVIYYNGIIYVSSKMQTILIDTR